MMRTTSIRHLAGLAFVLMGAGSAAAAPIVYSELDSGDLNPSVSVGTLDAGVNTVVGQFCQAEAATVCTNGSDADSFGFTLPSGLRIDDITFGFTTTFLADPTTLQTRFNLSGGGVDEESTVTLTPVGTQVMFPASLPVEGLIDFGIFHELLGRPSAGYTVDYTWRIGVSQVSQIPEPATAVLLGLALAGLGFSRRKRVTN